MEPAPHFDEAIRRLRAFMQGQGWPESIVWRRTDDVLQLPGPTVIVRARAESTANAWARRYYDEGVRAGVGISLNAACIVHGHTCATIFWTHDEQTAELGMIPKCGLKVGYSERILEARSHGAIRWWVDRRALARNHRD